MAAKGPGVYSDIGKKARELLFKGYNTDQKITICTYSPISADSPTGAAFTTSGTKQGELYTGYNILSCYSQLKNKLYITDFKLDTEYNLFTTITVSELTPGAKAIISSKVPDPASWKVELQYLHDYAGISGNIEFKPNPIVNLSGVFGTNALAFGGDISYDTNLRKLTKSDVGVTFIKNKLVGALTLNEKGDVLNASCYHVINALTSTVVGVDMGHRFSTKENNFTLGFQHELYPLTTLKGRVTNSAKASALIQHKWRTKTLITISTEVDTRAIVNSAKIGLSLVLKP